MASGVPNLGLDDLVVDVNAASGELDADGGLGLEAELVARESRQEVRLSDAGVSDQNHLEQVIVVVLRSVRSHFLSSVLFLELFFRWVCQTGIMGKLRGRN